MKKLSISVLCSGRLETTERCLKSFEKIRNQVDSELVVIDTGCDEKLRKILTKYADKVVRFSWTGDFAEARNKQLEETSGEWFMFLDDDEFIEDAEALIDFFTRPQTCCYSFGKIVIKNYSDKHLTTYSSISLTRLAKRTNELKFVGKIHEHFEYKSGEIVSFPSTVGHTGYIFKDDIQRIAHSKRNLPAILEMLNEDPESLSYQCLLLQEYNAMADYSNMISYGLKFYQSSKNVDSNLAIKARGCFVAALVKAWSMSNDVSKVVEIYEEACSNLLINEMAIAYCSSIAMVAYVFDNQIEKALSVGEYYLDRIARKSSFDEQKWLLYEDTFSEKTIEFVTSYYLKTAMENKAYEAILEYKDVLLKWATMSIELANVIARSLLGDEEEIIGIIAGYFSKDANGESAIFNQIRQYEKAATLENYNICGRNIKKYSSLIYAYVQSIRIEKLDQMRVNDQKMFDEMQQLEEEIIRQSSDNKEIIKQVQQMLLDTFGVSTLKKSLDN